MTSIKLLKPVIELTPNELKNLIIRIEDEIKTLIDTNGDIKRIQDMSNLCGKLIEILNKNK
jgi:hypothetical protein